MKRNPITRILSLLLVLVMIYSAFVGCAESETKQSGFATIVLEGEPAVEYRVNLDKVDGNEGLISVFEYLKAEQGLSYTYEAGILSEVGSVKQNDDTQTYIWIWTSVEADMDVSAYATTKDYNGMTLTSSGVGATDMTVCDGAVIYIGTISWS